MLEGIETGYEEKYDFPHRDGPPERVYIFASVPRSGSTFLSHLLWESGCLGAPLEYLNFLPSSPYGAVSGDPAGQMALWRSLLRRRTSPNGVFGIKCFPAQMQELQQRNPALFVEVMATLIPQGRKALMVRLRRRDELAHAISYARAALSGVWRKEQEAGGAPQVDFHPGAVDHARKLIRQEEASWDRLLAQTGIEPLTLWYEDVVDTPADAVKAVGDYVGVTIDPGAAISIPKVEKQSETDPRRWAELYQAATRT